MRSFFLGDNELSGDLATVTGELYRHMARVLRLKAGSTVTLVDACGGKLRGQIEEIGGKSLTVRIVAREGVASGEQGLRITLYQGLPKGEKLDLILQKCTELGVSEVVTFDAVRSVVKLSAERSRGRLERCRKIAQEAARQCGRPSPPEIVMGGTLKEVLREARHQVKLLLWEEEQTARLRETLDAQEKPEEVAVVVGPEGGLSAEEVKEAMAAGFAPVSLGSRILRTETAGMAMLSILQFYWGDLG